MTRLPLGTAFPKCVVVYFFFHPATLIAIQALATRIVAMSRWSLLFTTRVVR
jgi:hypothetical protein